MTTAALPLDYFDKIITEQKIQFTVKGHGGGKVSKEIL